MADESLRAAAAAARPTPPPTRFGMLASYFRGAPRSDELAQSAGSTKAHPAASSDQQADTSRRDVSGPITAPGGWGALLTWRGAPPIDSAAADEASTASHKDAETSAHAHLAETTDVRRDTRSHSGTQPRRSRAAIPFSRDSTSDAALGHFGSGTATALPHEARDRQAVAPHMIPQTDQLAAKLAEAASPAVVAGDAPTPAYATLSRLSKRPSFAPMHHVDEAQGVRRPSGQAPRAVDATVWRDEWTAEKEAHEKIDEVVRLCISQAGLDWELRPLVVLSVASLPDQRRVDYDALLERLLAALSLYVESEYSVVLLAAGGKHRPAWSWIWKAHRIIDRKYRKNLKKLYIVHPTLFTRTLVQFVSKGSYFVSPKFARKIVQCASLSELASHVPLSQIELPPEVLVHDLSLSDGLQTRNAAEEGEQRSTAIFGVPLDQLMGPVGERDTLPRVVRDCVEALRHDVGPTGQGISGLDTDGIFRRSPSSVLLRAAQTAYDGGHPVVLARYGDMHLPAALLKTYLRELPPIFPSELYPLISACPSPFAAEEEALQFIRQRILPAVQPPCNLLLLGYVIELMHDVAARSSRNRMDAANLATVLAPNLVRSSDPLRDIAICRVDGLQSRDTSTKSQLEKRGSASTGPTTLGTVLRLCIERAYELFEQVASEPPTLPRHDLSEGPNEPGAQASSTIADAVLRRARATTSSSLGTVSASSSAQSSPTLERPPWLKSGTVSPVLPASPQPVPTALASTSTATRASASAERPASSTDALTSPASRKTARSIVGTTGDSTTHRASRFSGTLGRSSSTSLRLTSARLQSSGSIRSPSSPAAASGATFAAVSPSASATDICQLLGSTSGVALAGISASGSFTGGPRIVSGPGPAGAATAPEPRAIASGHAAGAALGDAPATPMRLHAPTAPRPLSEVVEAADATGS